MSTSSMLSRVVDWIRLSRGQTENVLGSDKSTSIRFSCTNTLTHIHREKKEKSQIKVSKRI